MKRLLLFAGPALLVVIGLVLVVSHALAGQAAARSDGWKQARGTIERVGRGKGQRLLDVSYRYVFGGREYRSERVTYGSLSKKDLPSRLRRYRAGRTVLIYVNPANPSEAVLELGRRPAQWPSITGGLAMFAGIVLSLGFWRIQIGNPQRKKIKKTARPMSRLKPPPAIKRPPPPPEE